MTTQKERVLIHLFENGSIDVTDQPKVRLTRLAAIILQLKKSGVKIDAYRKTIVSKYQKSHINVYYLA